jgi:hypothetical protein
MTKTERMVHLALSQKAARLLKEVIESAILDYDDDEDIGEILTLIHNDLVDQIEEKPKKKGVKKRGK